MGRQGAGCGALMPLSFSLPKRRPVARSGILRAAQRIWPRHRKFVRSHGCCVPDCPNTDIEFAHIRSAANSGTGLKPHDAFGISLCARHHKMQHEIGQPAFERKFGIDMNKLAAAFVKASPDVAMREPLQASPQTGL